MAEKQRFIVTGPDGMPIGGLQKYDSKEEAKLAIRVFVNRYRSQGYYYKEVVVRTKIPIDEIADECRIIEI
jgi:hypothetical protein